MSTWDDIMGLAAMHDRGRWFNLPHPVTGAASGVELLVAGPAGVRCHVKLDQLRHEELDPS